jgi:gluconolactonase
MIDVDYFRAPIASRFTRIERIALLLAAYCAIWPTSNIRGADYADLNTDAYLGAVQVLCEIVDEQVFTEGPAVDRNGDLFFTNVPMNKILKWTADHGLSVFRTDSNQTNGLFFLPDGNLLRCEGGKNRVSLQNMTSGKIKVLADKYQGLPLAKPNDLCVDSKGRIYFTSRSAIADPKGENPKAVYRIDPDGSLHQLLAWPQVHMPNGIVLSPDDSKLYLIEAHPDADHHRDIRVYDVDAQGDLSNGRVLINFYPGRSGDGMCIDSKGNLYVAAGLHKTRKTSETLATRPGIHVISPAGQLLAFRQTPVDTITNCTFGGSDFRVLYVTCGDKLLRIRTTIAGKSQYRPTR